MNDKSDIQLLRDYAEGRDEAAFREIVTRHTDFVYSAALRQMGSSDAAADVAQSVFVDLARKASSLAQDGRHPSTSLAGWLHRATRFSVLNHLRDARRRTSNERQAMEQLLTDAESSATEWEQIRPMLDEALDALADDDREALLLRYFKNHNFRDVGLALGVTDDAAQKRVSRAVEKLREIFSKQKITIGAGGLVVLISANAAQSAPVALTATISAAALAGTSVSTTTAITATKTIAMTTLKKSLITATIAIVAGIGIYEAWQNSILREQVQALQQQQAPLTEQIQQLQHERDEASNKFAAANEMLSQEKANQSELLKLRGEVGWFRRQKADNEKFTSQENQASNIVSVLPKARNFDNNQVISANESDDYAKQLSDFGRTNNFTGDARNFQFALRRYAEDHAGQIPQQFSDLEPYKWTGELPLAGTYLGTDTLAGTNYFDLVYHASLNDLANNPDKKYNIAILRQRDAWPTPGGKWAKVYVTYGRTVFLVESDDNFATWETEHLINSP